jgi:hypothetical protein
VPSPKACVEISGGSLVVWPEIKIQFFHYFYCSMLINEVRQQIQDIIRGAIIEGQGDRCRAVRNHLCASFRTSRTVKKDFEGQSIVKEKQAAGLKRWALTNSCLINNLPPGWQYLAQGGEAIVYLDAAHKNVIKLNDGIYYATWLEYFNSLVLHNLFFPDTAYDFLGFMERSEDLIAVVQQPFIPSEGIASLESIKALLGFNGFENTKRQDYFNQEFGLILEDMHDENVIAKDDLLFFIDTVFYIIDPGNQRT